MKNALIFSVFLTAFLTPFITKAQYENFEKQKAELIIDIYRDLVWPNDNSFDYIVIGIIDCSAEMEKELNKAKPKRMQTGIKIDIISYSNIEEIHHKSYTYPHIIYIASNNEADIQKLLNIIKDKPTILITDSWDNKLESQINLVTENSGQTISFEYNLENIKKQKISVPDKFIGMDGINLSAEKLLDETELKLIKKEQELERKKQELEKKELELEKKDNEIKRNEEIIQTKEEIIIKLETVISYKNKEIMEKERKIKEKNAEIERLKNNQ